jgi:predicted MFS family arabinose efflux permease
MIAGWVAFLNLYAPQPLLPLLARIFHKTPARVSLLITVSTLAVALAAPFVGMLADRWGRKRVIVPAALLLALPTVATALARSFNQLLLCRFCQGLLIPAVFAATVTYINEEWKEGAGAAIAAYVSGTVLGGFSGRMVCALLTAHLGWQAGFAVLGALNLAGGLLVWAWLPPDRSVARRLPPDSWGPLQHLRNPQLMATCAAGFCVLFCLLGTFTYVNFYLAAAPFRLGTGALGLLFVVYLVGAATNPLAGRGIDRFGHRLTIPAVLALSIAGSLLTLIHYLPAVVAGLAIFCAGMFGAQSTASSYIGRAAKHAQASAVGLYVTAYYIGGSFGSAVPGHLWSLGGWPACVALMTVVQVGTVALALLFWQRPSVAPSALRQTAEAAPSLPARVFLGSPAD